MRAMDKDQIKVRLKPNNLAQYLQLGDSPHIDGVRE